MSLQFSPTIGAITQAIVNAQSEMETAKKNADNPGFATPQKPKGSKYADLTEIIDVTKVYQKHGIAITQHCGASDLTYPGVEGAVLVQYAEVTTLLSHVSGEWMSSTIKVTVGGKKDAHAWGSAYTYAKRYGLAACGLVATEDDDGNGASIGEEDKPKNTAASKPAKPAPTATPEEYTRLVAELKAKGKDTDALVKSIAAAADAKKLKTGTVERLAFVIEKLKQEVA